MATETMKAQHAVEAVLAHRAENEPGFVERVALDPKRVIGPIIAEVLEDDGDLDLSGVSINVHFQTADQLHFTIPVEASEVEGFMLGKFGSPIRMMEFEVMSPRFSPTILGNSQMEPASTNGESDAKCKPSTL